MAENNGKGTLERPGYEMPVAVANARGGHPDQNFPLPGVLQRQILDNKRGSSTFSVVLAQYPLLRRRNLSTYFERYYRNV